MTIGKIISMILVVSLVCCLLGMTFEGLTSKVVGSISIPGSMFREAMLVFSLTPDVNAPKYTPIGEDFSWNPWGVWGFGRHNVYSETDIASAKNVLALLNSVNFQIDGAIVRFESKMLNKQMNYNFVSGGGGKIVYSQILFWLSVGDYNYLMEKLG